MFFLFSCNVQKNINVQNHLPQISTKKLLQNNIIPPNSHYKSRYYSMLPYLFYNGKGDYFSLKHPIYEEVNIMIGYWEELGEYRNILLAVVWVKSKTQYDLTNLDINVVSSKHGLMIPKYRHRDRDSNFNNEIAYTVKIPLEYERQIIDKVNDDVVTITVNGYKYEMLNPELKLD